jgi:hypothetical protein
MCLDAWYTQKSSSTSHTHVHYGMQAVQQHGCCLLVCQLLLLLRCSEQMVQQNPSSNRDVERVNHCCLMLEQLLLRISNSSCGNTRRRRRGHIYANELRTAAPYSGAQSSTLTACVWWSWVQEGQEGQAGGFSFLWQAAAYCTHGDRHPYTLIHELTPIHTHKLTSVNFTSTAQPHDGRVHRTACDCSAISV